MRRSSESFIDACDGPDVILGHAPDGGRDVCHGGSCCFERSFDQASERLSLGDQGVDDSDLYVRDKASDSADCIHDLRDGLVYRQVCKVAKVFDYSVDEFVNGALLLEDSAVRVHPHGADRPARLLDVSEEVSQAPLALELDLVSEESEPGRRLSGEAVQVGGGHLDEAVDEVSPEAEDV